MFNQMENYNYYNDPRVKYANLNLGKIVGDYLVIEVVEEDDIKLRCHMVVCDMCRGHGTHVNPSIDAGGVSFDGDPDFAEEYISGRYDVTCVECGGLRVVPGVDREAADPDMLKRYDEWVDEEYRYAEESAAERRMGA